MYATYRLDTITFYPTGLFVSVGSQISEAQRNG